ncbi:group II intron maturase-specific domain-containing protein [Megasphaera sueciensis]|uniref:group II intron maturase-specific domain-containing protein n=1 Tax=Megasphaera sueciensis TaxID=349094 RepID=UPI003D0412D8
MEDYSSNQLHRYTGSKIEMLAERMNPIVRGWLNCFTKYNPSAVKCTMNCLKRRLVK